MAVYKDKNGTWYVSARYTNWKGEADRKLKRGFQTKKEATEWERNFFLENAGNLEMTFEAFYELYKKNMQDRIKLSTWKYDITKHPNYKYLSDASDKNYFDIEKYLSTHLRTKPEDVYEVFEVDASDEVATA